MIEKPSCWSKEFYIQKKNERLTDKEIAESLFVSIQTLYRWKRKLGFKAGDFHNHGYAIRKGMTYKKT